MVQKGPIREPEIFGAKKRHQLPQKSRKWSSPALLTFPEVPPLFPEPASLFPESPDGAPPSQNPSGTPRGPLGNHSGNLRNIFGTPRVIFGKPSEHLRKSSATPRIVVGHPSEIFGTSSENRRKPLRNHRVFSEIIGNPSESHRAIPRGIANASPVACAHCGNRFFGLHKGSYECFGLVRRSKRYRTCSSLARHLGFECWAR